ncbi:MAG TPA: hypothetical protein VGU01_00940 [Sphingomicrobium sp.]|nr:hypothetical protein [Sphingomicrobium sp.]
MNRFVVGSLIAVSVLVACPAAQAKERPIPASPLVAAIDRCRQIADSGQRLACYDAAAGALVTATTAGDVSIVDRSEVRKVRHSLFGFSLPKVPFFSGDTTANEAQSKLDSTIVSVRPLANGYFRIVIADNNAVWETTDDSISFSPPQPGQKIEIVRGALGNYFIRVNGQIGVRGHRVG